MTTQVLKYGYSFAVPGWTSYLLESYPPIERIVNANPGGVFGVPQFRDPKTGEIVIEGRRGIGGSTRTDYDISQYRGLPKDRIVQLLNTVGVTVKLIDTMRNLQYSHEQMGKKVTEMVGIIGQINNELSRMEKEGQQETDEYKRLQLKKVHAIDATVQIDAELLRLTKMMQEKGVKPSEVLDELDSFGDELFKIKLEQQDTERLVNKYKDMY